MADEEEIRQFMIMYALNDCLTVTKLVHELPSPSNSTLPTSTITNDLEAVSDNEFEFDYKQEPVNKWPINEISYDIDIYGKNEFVKLYDDIKIDDTPTYDILTRNDKNKGYARNDPQNDIEIISDDDEQQPTNNNKYQQHSSDKPLTRNQKKSRKKRAKRYRFEIIREIYREFTITQIK
ncbi:unnamed protein product, partial [Rotaria magnacalcarata]